jgi:hypothetical protein
VVAASVTLDYLKHVGNQKRRLEVGLADDSERPVSDQRFKTALLMSDVERAFAAIDFDERDRAIFWLGVQNAWRDPCILFLLVGRLRQQ